MAVMINTLGRRAQAQSDAPQAVGQAEGEAPVKEKVSWSNKTFISNAYKWLFKKKFFFFRTHHMKWLLHAVDSSAISVAHLVKIKRPCLTILTSS